MENFGVVIQGRGTTPSLLKKIVETYKEAGAAKIVLSVYPEWVDREIDDVEFVPVILTEEEKVICTRTNCHVNYQILTTNRGLHTIDGVDFVFRTRADQLYPNFKNRVNLWIERIKEFDYGSEGLFRSKIVHWKELPGMHAVTDFWQFGYLEDIRRLYDIRYLPQTKWTIGKVSETTITCGYLSQFFNQEPRITLHKEAPPESVLSTGSDFNWMELRDKYFLFDPFLLGEGKHFLTPWNCGKGWPHHDSSRREWMKEGTVYSGYSTSTAYMQQ